MEKALLSRKNLNECAEFEYAYHLAVINGTCLRNSDYTLNPSFGCCHCFSIIGRDIDNSDGTLSIRIRFFGDGDGSACLLLNLLDGFTTLADDGTDEL